MCSNNQLIHHRPPNHSHHLKPTVPIRKHPTSSPPDTLLRHVTVTTLEGPGILTLCRRPRILRAFWAGLFAANVAPRRKVPPHLIAVAVRRRFKVRAFDIPSVYPRKALQLQHWMTVREVARAFPAAFWRGSTLVLLRRQICKDGHLE